MTLAWLPMSVSAAYMHTPALWLVLQVWFGEWAGVWRGRMWPDLLPPGGAMSARCPVKPCGGLSPTWQHRPYLRGQPWWPCSVGPCCARCGTLRPHQGAIMLSHTACYIVWSYECFYACADVKCWGNVVTSIVLILRLPLVWYWSSATDSTSIFIGV